jgi:LPXTG-motif cell wall-anchored protein
MKRFNLSKAVSTGVITLSGVILPLILSSCVNRPANTVRQDTPPPAGVIITREDDDFDWSWLGLIGLAGLAGLAGLGGKKRQQPTAYRDPNR